MARKKPVMHRECLICKKVSLVRKDTAGTLCRLCHAKKLCDMRWSHEMIGKKFGILTVVSFFEKIKNILWYLCECLCGNKKPINGSSLRLGRTTSCGCIRKNKNGLSRSRTYNSWRAMMQRCYNSKAINYVNYGNRGIKVCDKWHNFKDFLSDMGERPLNLSLDRIDNDGNYSLENCRWASPQQQALNRRKGAIVSG